MATNKENTISILSNIVSHTDIVEFKFFIEKALSKNLSDNVHLQHMKQMLSNGTINALILCQQNGISYNELYHATM